MVSVQFGFETFTSRVVYTRESASEHFLWKSKQGALCKPATYNGKYKFANLGLTIVPEPRLRISVSWKIRTYLIFLSTV